MRLIRALQSGGVATLQAADAWGVWRRPDRRSRMIGTLPGVEVDVLRVQDRLKPLGAGLPLTLVWHGPVDHPVARKSAPSSLTAPSDASYRSVLENLIIRCLEPTRRDGIRRTIAAYRRDFLAVQQSTTNLTMNWDRLRSGDAIRGRQPSDPLEPALQKVQAERALAAIDAVLTSNDRAFLNGLVNTQAKKPELARRFGIRAGLIDAKALALLRRIASVYKIDLD